jgi:hypothetical protein
MIPSSGVKYVAGRVSHHFSSFCGSSFVEDFTTMNEPHLNADGRRMSEDGASLRCLYHSSACVGEKWRAAVKTARHKTLDLDEGVALRFQVNQQKRKKMEFAPATKELLMMRSTS